MFLVDDTIEMRHARIRAFQDDQIMIGPLLAAIDFEWTVRRAIIALGYETTSVIRQEVLRHCHGLDAYKAAWAAQVLPLHGKRLHQIIHRWSYLSTQAYPLRHRIVHGVKNTVGEDYARKRRDCLLEASASIVGFVLERGANVYGRLPVRRKPREIPS